MASLKGMLKDLASVKSRISGFYRPNKFLLMLLAPASGKVLPIPLPLDPVIVKVANMPTRTMNEIVIKKLGMEYSIPTFNTYGDLVVTITTWHFADYRMMHSWMTAIHSVSNIEESNARFEGIKSVEDFKVTANLGATSDKGGLLGMVPIHNMVLKGVYPKEISEVRFSQEASTEFISYDVTFNVDTIDMI